MAMAAPAGRAQRPLSITCEARDGKAVIRVVGDITGWSNTADDFEQQVDGLVRSGVRDAHVYINTRGGDVFQANEIVNAIKRFPGTLTGSGGAMVASAGTMIALHLAEFKMASNGMWMYHKPEGSFDGNEEQVASQLKLLKDLTAQYRALYAERAGLTEDEIEKRWAKAPVWLTAQEALAQGFISGIADAEPMPEEDVNALAAMGAPKDKLKIAASAAPNQPTMDIKALRTILGMPESATEEQVLAKAKQLKEANERHLEAAAQLRANEVKALIDKAITEKRITEAHRKGFESKFNADFDATKAELEAIAPVATLKTEPATPGSGAAVAKGREAWDYPTWADRDLKGLHALMKSDPEKFAALYEAHYGVKPTLPTA